MVPSVHLHYFTDLIVRWPSCKYEYVTTAVGDYSKTSDKNDSLYRRTQGNRCFNVQSWPTKGDIPAQFGLTT